MIRKFKTRELDKARIWADTAQNLMKYYSHEGLTEISVLKALSPAIDLFEKTLKEGLKKNEK